MSAGYCSAGERKPCMWLGMVRNCVRQDVHLADERAMHKQT